MTRKRIRLHRLLMAATLYALNPAPLRAEPASTVQDLLGADYNDVRSVHAPVIDHDFSEYDAAEEVRFEHQMNIGDTQTGGTARRIPVEQANIGDHGGQGGGAQPIVIAQAVAPVRFYLENRVRDFVSPVDGKQKVRCVVFDDGVAREAYEMAYRERAEFDMAPAASLVLRCPGVLNSGEIRDLLPEVLYYFERDGTRVLLNRAPNTQ